MRIPHDQLFKELLSAFFLEFLELFAPDLYAQLDPGTLQWMDKELYPESTRTRRKQVDLVAQVGFLGRKTSLVVHVENESSARNHFPRRMFVYAARLAENSGLPVYPIVVYSYAKPLKAGPDRYVLEVAGKRVFEFHFHVVQLNRLHWRDFLDHPNPVASALMARMKIAPRERPLVKLECLRMLTRFRMDQRKSRLISKFVDAYLSLDAVEEAVLERRLEELMPKEKRQVREFMTSWERKGLALGLEQGLARGIEQGIERGEGRWRLAERREMVQRMVASGMSREQVVQATGLGREELDRLLGS